MTDQNEREWPSFGDILDELNSLGGLPSSVIPVANPAPAEHSDSDAVEHAVEPPSPVNEMPEQLEEPTVPAGPFDELAPEASPEPELSEEPKWASLESVDDQNETGDPAASATEGVEASPDDQKAGTNDSSALAVADSIDWSSWDFDTTSAAPTNDLSHDFEPSQSMGDKNPADPTPIFEFDLGAIDNEPDSTWNDLPIDEAGPIDSVATADAIETDLQELFGMVEVDESDSEEGLDSLSEDPASPAELAALADEGMPDHADGEAIPTDSPDGGEGVEEESSDDAADNVVPLHRAGDDLSHHLVGLDEVFDPARPQPVESTSSTAEFVGIEADETKGTDNWDYLRPGEDESVKASVFARRPKFFGGAERKARKAERKQAESKEQASGPPCPKCDAVGRIDLNDPIGGKIHCSCLECDHVWSELAPANQESA